MIACATKTNDVCSLIILMLRFTNLLQIFKFAGHDNSLSSLNLTHMKQSLVMYYDIASYGEYHKTTMWSLDR